MTKVAAIIQARTGSTRLPGKVLRDVRGKPMVIRVLERAARIDGVDEVVAALPALDADDHLAGVVEDHGVRVIRGPADDVLGRYVAAARASRAEVVVRITGDCPLLSPTVSSRVLQAYLHGGCDYASNTITRTWPRGLDTEVLSTSLLELVDSEPRTPAEREHVTLAVWRQPERFRLCSVAGETDLSGLRWTVDTEADLTVVAELVEGLEDPDSADVAEILAVLRAKPELARRNEQIAQRLPDG